MARSSDMKTSLESLCIIVTFLSVVLIPLEILNIIKNIVPIEEEIENPNAFMEAIRKGRL